MKFLPFGLITLLLSTVAFAVAVETGGQSNEPNARIRIARFHGDRAAALSYTFDDGLRDHYTQAAPMLEEFGFHGTFFIIGKVVTETDEEAVAKKPGAQGGVSWSQVQDLAARGHEIGNHSWSHRQLTKCTDEELAEEIDRNRLLLTEKLGVAPVTFCYPGNSRNDTVRAAVMENHIAARESQFEIGQPTLTAADANAWADENIAKGGWGIAMIHGISAGYHPLSSPEVLCEHLSYVKTHDDQIWVDTFANVARYVAERDAAEITIRKQTSSSVVVILDSPLSSPPYNQPLTLLIDAPTASMATATRAGKPLAVTIKDNLLLVDTVPSSDEIHIEWK